jgi:hypothetical protein
VKPGTGADALPGLLIERAYSATPLPAIETGKVEKLCSTAFSNALTTPDIVYLTVVTHFEISKVEALRAGDFWVKVYICKSGS